MNIGLIFVVLTLLCLGYGVYTYFFKSKKVSTSPSDIVIEKSPATIAKDNDSRTKLILEMHKIKIEEERSIEGTIKGVEHVIKMLRYDVVKFCDYMKSSSRGGKPKKVFLDLPESIIICDLNGQIHLAKNPWIFYDPKSQLGLRKIKNTGVTEYDHGLKDSPILKALMEMVISFSNVENKMDENIFVSDFVNEVLVLSNKRNNTHPRKSIIDNYGGIIDLRKLNDQIVNDSYLHTLSPEEIKGFDI